jgi:hypothetical protein
LLWPAATDIYLVPIIPLFLFYAIVGFESLTSSAKPKLRTAMAAALMLMVIAGYAGKYSRLRLHSFGEMETAGPQRLFHFVANNTSPNDVIVFRRARALTLFTQREASPYHWVRNDNDLWQYFCSIHAAYLIDGPIDFSDPVPGAPDGFFIGFIERHEGELQTVYSNSGFNVYKIRNGSCSSMRTVQSPAPSKRSAVLRSPK